MKLAAYVLLAVFLILYGLMAVTNFRIEFMGVIVGLAALAAGIAIGIAIGRREL